LATALLYRDLYVLVPSPLYAGRKLFAISSYINTSTYSELCATEGKKLIKYCRGKIFSRLFHEFQEGSAKSKKY
jgi:hypothetical protein